MARLSLKRVITKERQKVRASDCKKIKIVTESNDKMLVR